MELAEKGAGVVEVGKKLKGLTSSSVDPGSDYSNKKLWKCHSQGWFEVLSLITMSWGQGFATASSGGLEVRREINPGRVEVGGLVFQD